MHRARSLIVSALGGLVVLTTPARPGAGTFDAVCPSYRITASVDVDSHLLEGVEELTVSNGGDAPLDRLVFNVYAAEDFADERAPLDLASNYFKVEVYPEGYSAGSCRAGPTTRDGLPAELAARDAGGTVWSLRLHPPLGPGEATTVVIPFRVELAHMLWLTGYHGGIDTYGYWYPLLAVHDENGWHPRPMGVNHQPFFAPSADYEVTIESGAGVVIAAPGELTGEVVAADGGVRRTFVLPHAREFAFCAGRGYSVEEVKSGVVTVRSYYTDGNSHFGRLAAEYAAEVLRYYSSLYTPYDLPTFSVIESRMPWMGNEFSGCIFIDGRAYDVPNVLQRHVEFLISHETAHQWWHHRVGNDQFSHSWLDEAFASYAQQLYLEGKYGVEDNYYELPEALSFLPTTSFREARRSRYIFAVRRGWDQAILTPIDSYTHYESAFVLPYDKGMWVLDMLRYLVGDDVYFDIQREYLERYAWLNATPEDFTAVAEDVSGEDLGGFFDDWLRTGKVCDYAVSESKTLPGPGTYLTTVTVERRGDIAMPIDVALVLADAGRVVERWDGRGAARVLTFETTSRPVRAVVDPDRRVLDAYPLNNSKPTSVRTVLSPYYAQAYDIYIFSRAEDYNLFIGTPINFFNVGLRVSGRAVHDHFWSADVRWDFHRQLLLKQVEGLLEHKPWPDTNTEVTLWHHEHIDEVGEMHRGARLGLFKELRSSIPSLDPLTNEIGVFVQRSDDWDIDYDYADALAGLQYRFDSRVPMWSPTSGYRGTLTAARAEDVLGADQRYNKFTADLRAYYELPIPADDHVAAVRVFGGLTNPPRRNLFSLGGVDSMRGYRQGRGDGASKLLGQVEYRFPISERRSETLLWRFITFNRLGGVLFFDTGRVWDDEYEEGDWREDVGLGLRFDTTILGFVERVMGRFDIAFPTDEWDHPQVWIFIGHTF